MEPEVGGEVAVILIEVYAVEGHPGTVIQSVPRWGRAAWSPYISYTLHRGLPMTPLWMLPGINPVLGPAWRDITGE